VTEEGDFDLLVGKIALELYATDAIRQTGRSDRTTDPREGNRDHEADAHTGYANAVVAEMTAPRSALSPSHPREGTGNDGNDE